MLRFILDTDHLSLYQHRHPSLLQHIAAQPIGAIGISPISMEETLRGRLAVLSRQVSGAARIQAYTYLVDAVAMLNLFPIAPFDLASEVQFQNLRGSRIRVGSQDLRIAAIAPGERANRGQPKPQGLWPRSWTGSG
jgi:tRNA(fMet)-specific endonuclease VapC